MPSAGACERFIAGIAICIGAGAACVSGCVGIGIAGAFGGAARTGSAVRLAGVPCSANKRFAGVFFFGEAFFVAAGCEAFGIFMPGMFICAQAGPGSKSAATAKDAALATNERK